METLLIECDERQALSAIRERYGEAVSVIPIEVPSCRPINFFALVRWNFRLARLTSSTTPGDVLLLGDIEDWRDHLGTVGTIAKRVFSRNLHILAYTARASHEDLPYDEAARSLTSRLFQPGRFRQMSTSAFLES